MTGGAAFNEVFFDDVEVPDADRLGDVGAGWEVALTTLSHERNAMGNSSFGYPNGPNRLARPAAGITPT